MNADPVFKALSDPSRRALFERICRDGALTVHALTDGSGISQPAVSKHLAALKRAGLVVGRPVGRETFYAADLQALQPLVNWIGVYGAFWNDRIDALTQLLHRMDQ
ncbi:MAG: metalloregulator ArsR/SmtB family transcription factor [bacterium]